MLRAFPCVIALANAGSAELNGKSSDLIGGSTMLVVKGSFFIRDPHNKQPGGTPG
jgi:hypothetical protein